jgi:glutaredoxin
MHRMETVARAMMLALLAATAAGAQTVYKSTNPDGSVVYSDKPPAGGKIDKIITFPDLPSSPLQPLAVQPLSRQPQARKAQPAPSSRSVNVTLYSAAWCGYCKRAKSYLVQHAIPYENVDVDTLDGRDAFERAGKGGIPLLVAGKRRVRGFKQEGYDAFFASRR